MITWNWDKDRKWTSEDIMAYFLQQIALMMQEMMRAANRDSFSSRMWDEQSERRRVAEVALALMVHREDIIMAFEGCSSQTLSQFQRNLERQRYRYTVDELRQAISMTDYLVLVPSGNGYRVWRTEDYHNARQAEAG